jgi:hypothetical protein
MQLWLSFTFLLFIANIHYMFQPDCKARVFRRDSPPTQSKSTGSGGESSSMLTSVERRLLAMKANE